MKSEKLCVERETLWALTHHMLDAREESNVKTHVAECPACREALESYARLDAVLGEWALSEPSPWFDARVRAAVASAHPARRSWLGAAWVRWAAPAFAALLIVAGIGLLRQRRHTNRSSAINTTTSVQATNTPAVQARTADQEISLYENLPVLEDYDLLSSADVLSELPKQAGQDGKVAD